ncbi:helix-turn-helix domain-containing protein [Salipiger sp. 1_MG-2023]|uniref:GlxA family transcriptional regulator n=1 Tax=Salipiger sp. 1_MG-2023 TaxID=3062665 RepID=UPI0026E40FFE|nr:helix-turn-helix domain-containing protein [Salipiger sp. 1_MG-2023]MDO6588432.1 helix-turn-helix domain-containing protein [Salipiger sp. 1_MG-2023]
MTNVTFLLFDGFSNMVLSCLLEPLRAVRDQGQADLHWQILSPDNGPVCSSSGLSITPDGRTHAPQACDLLIVLAGYGFRAHAQGDGPAVIRRLSRHAQVVVGADTGAWLLASAELISDHPVTLHWAVLSEFAEAFPQAQLRFERYLKTGRIWSCGGASSALDLMLAFIAERFGPASAFFASTMFLHDAERQQTHGRGPGRLAGKGTAKLRQTVNLMVETMETPLTLKALADKAGLTVRSLDRLFQAELGMAPGRYYQLMRLSHARDLAASTEFDLREIALRCGYSDASALSKAFSRAFGHPIRKSRGNRPR